MCSELSFFHPELLVVVVVICYFSFFLVVCLLNFNVFSFWPVQLLRQSKVEWRWVQSLSYWITLVNVILKSQCSVNNLQGVQALHLITWRYSKNYGLIKQGFYSKLVNGSLPVCATLYCHLLAYKQPSWLGFPFQLCHWHNQWLRLDKVFEIPDQRYFFTWSCMDNNFITRRKINFSSNPYSLILISCLPERKTCLVKCILRGKFHTFKSQE